MWLPWQPFFLVSYKGVNPPKPFKFWNLYTIINPMKYSNAYAKINLENLVNNYKMVCSHNEGKTPICVVKADAYGHGSIMCAKALEGVGAKWFAVASLDEAKELREGGINGNILILGYIPLERLDEFVLNNLACGVYSLSFAKELNNVARTLGRVVNVHIKLNTGMNRLGFDCSKADFEAKIREIVSLENLKITGVFSHYSTCDEADLSYSEMQRSIFEKGVELIKNCGANLELVHISNSAASLWFDCKTSNAFRPGIVLYGVSPLPQRVFQGELKPVMSLFSHVANIFVLKEGCSLGYGRKYTAPSNRRIATLSVGYADGYFRALSNKAWVYIKGHRAPVVGNVCMDMLMVDITDVPAVHVGDEAELFGEHIDVCELSSLAGTIPYEIMCALSKRVKRIYE